MTFASVWRFAAFSAFFRKDRLQYMQTVMTNRQLFIAGIKPANRAFHRGNVPNLHTNANKCFNAVCRTGIRLLFTMVLIQRDAPTTTTIFFALVTAV